MIDANQIAAGMEVADTAGQHIGTVDRVQDDVVALTGEGFTDTLHHFVPLAAVTAVGDGRITVEPATLSSVEAMAESRTIDAGPNTPLFGTSGVGTGFGGSGRGEY